MIQKDLKVSIVKAVRNIWENEANMVKIVEENGRLYAECETTMYRGRLTEENYENVLNDMFYDYCLENADWMGVS